LTPTNLNSSTTLFSFRRADSHALCQSGSVIPVGNTETLQGAGGTGVTGKFAEECDLPAILPKCARKTALISHRAAQQFLQNPPDERRFRGPAEVDSKKWIT
jgi:hypothetical protein